MAPRVRLMASNPKGINQYHGRGGSVAVGGGGGSMVSTGKAKGIAPKKAADRTGSETASAATKGKIFNAKGVPKVKVGIGGGTTAAAKPTVATKPKVAAKPATATDHSTGLAHERDLRFVKDKTPVGGSSESHQVHAGGGLGHLGMVEGHVAHIDTLNASGKIAIARKVTTRFGGELSKEHASRVIAKHETETGQKANYSLRKILTTTSGHTSKASAAKALHKLATGKNTFSTDPQFKIRTSG